MPSAYFYSVSRLLRASRTKSNPQVWGIWESTPSRLYNYVHRHGLLNATGGCSYLIQMNDKSEIISISLFVKKCKQKYINMNEIKNYQGLLSIFCNSLSLSSTVLKIIENIFSSNISQQYVKWKQISKKDIMSI